jgi:hypothetical protein
MMADTTCKKKNNFFFNFDGCILYRWRYSCSFIVFVYPYYELAMSISFSGSCGQDTKEDERNTIVFKVKHQGKRKLCWQNSDQDIYCNVKVYYFYAKCEGYVSIKVECRPNCWVKAQYRGCFPFS